MDKKIDMVNHPSHYNKGNIECRKVIREMIIGYNPDEAVDIANITKYIYRSPYKNGLEDLKKARWYLDDIIKQREEFNDE